MGEDNYIENLERTFSEIVKEIEDNKIKYYSNDIKGIIALGYFSKIIENSKAIIILLKESNLQSAIMPILRNILEAIIDLDNILNIDGYIEYLHYLNLNNKLFLGNKKYFKEISKNKDYDYEITKDNIDIKEQKLKKQLQSRYGNKFFKINVKKGIDTSVKFKFELAKSMDTYDSLYWILCTDTHNNISSIEKCYIEKVSENLVVKPFNKMDKKNKNDISETTEYILKDANDRIKKILEL